MLPAAAGQPFALPHHKHCLPSLARPWPDAEEWAGTDDWQLDADTPVTEDGTSWAAVLTHLESPWFHGTLTIDRTEPTPDDLGVLEAIKSTVKEFSGRM